MLSHMTFLAACANFTTFSFSICIYCTYCTGNKNDDDDLRTGQENVDGMFDNIA